MSRPLRLEFAGALYHVTARGNERNWIFSQDDDFTLYLTVLDEVCERYNWVIHAYCLMSNHYHLLLETPDGNLSKGMRQLNGVFTQKINRKHNRVGHLFQGRYKSIVVDQETYLLELCRYIVLNPVRAKMVDTPDEWQWSSWPNMVGNNSSPDWLSTDSILLQFASDRDKAVDAYKRFVAEGVGVEVWSNLRQQVFLGDKAFVAKHLAIQNDLHGDLREVPLKQRRTKPKTLSEYNHEAVDRNSAMRSAYASGGYTLQQIADYFDVHYSTVSRIVNASNIR
ncbi:REP-associated tyrosine transposase [Vibrio breoganii]|uniref:REP-associated tyrosine transposase n=1 Tax=Vibrio breoganii TaxID=553239 RepID=UPI000C818E25|nr:transposase [Vibrio breoganii]PMO34085.1 addiction module toxin RelE [Vibrio breoganii]